MWRGSGLAGLGVPDLADGIRKGYCRDETTASQVTAILKHYPTPAFGVRDVSRLFS